MHFFCSPWGDSSCVELSRTVWREKPTGVVLQLRSPSELQCCRTMHGTGAVKQWGTLAGYIPARLDSFTDNLRLLAVQARRKLRARGSPASGFPPGRLHLLQRLLFAVRWPVQKECHVAGTAVEPPATTNAAGRAKIVRETPGHESRHAANSKKFEVDFPQAVWERLISLSKTAAGSNYFRSIFKSMSDFTPTDATCTPMCPVCRWWPQTEDH